MILMYDALYQVLENFANFEMPFPAFLGTKNPQKGDL